MDSTTHLRKITPALLLLAILAVVLVSPWSDGAAGGAVGSPVASPVDPCAGFGAALDAMNGIDEAHPIDELPPRPTAEDYRHLAEQLQGRIDAYRELSYPPALDAYVLAELDAYIYWQRGALAFAAGDLASGHRLADESVAAGRTLYELLTEADRQCPAVPVMTVSHRLK